MAARDSPRMAPLSAAAEAALNTVRDAGDAAAAAKRTRSVPLIARSHDGLQAAVDAARALDVPWGAIGVALGIARGNAYQRYRKSASRPGLSHRERAATVRAVPPRILGMVRP